MTKSRRISDEMTTRQILLYVNKVLTPYEICIRSYRGKAYNIVQLYEFDALIQRMNIQDIYYKCSMIILNHKMMVNQVVEYDTSALDEGIGSEL